MSTKWGHMVCSVHVTKAAAGERGAGKKKAPILLSAAAGTSVECRRRYIWRTAALPASQHTGSCCPGAPQRLLAALLAGAVGAAGIWLLGAHTLLASVHSVSRSLRSKVSAQGAPCCSCCSVELQHVSLRVHLLLLHLLLVMVGWRVRLLLQVTRCLR